MNDLRQQDTSSSDVSNTRRDDAGYDAAALMPPVDVVEDGSGITLQADLHGVARDKLNLQVHAGRLTIEADIGLVLPEGLQSSHTEVGLGRYRRTFTLSPELDTEKIGAELNNGVLKLTIPKADHAKPRRINVNVG